MSFAKFLRAPFFTEHLRWLLLWFILVASIVVTWVSWFSGHMFRLEAEDFIFHIFQRNFPNFSVKILALCSANSLRSCYFSLFRSQVVYTCSKYIRSQNGYFFLSLFTSYIIVQTNRQNKMSIQIFQSFLTNKAPLALIFFRGLHITCKAYYNLSIKGENYQLD